MKRLVPNNIIELIEYLQTLSSYERVLFFSNPEYCFVFWFYYFPQGFVCSISEWHEEYMYYLWMTELNMLVIGARWSLKTEIERVHAIWEILYAKEPYHVIQSYEQTASDQWVRNLAKMLTSKSIIEDYGNLHPYGQKRENFEKSGSADFDARNGVKVQAIALWENARGLGTYSDEGGSSRPTSLKLDDIDNDKSTYNKTVIDKNYDKITRETIGALSKEHSRIIFLWNVIRADWVVPRFEEEKKTDKNWKILRRPLYEDDGITSFWPAFFTPERVEKIKSDEGEKSFWPNYLLIPQASGARVFSPSILSSFPKLDYTVDKKYEDLRIYKPRNPDGSFENAVQLFFGSDTSRGWENGDYSSLSVRDIHWKLYLFFYGRIPSDILVDLIEYVLTEFKIHGRIGIEINNSGYSTIDIAKRRQWAHMLFKRKKVDEISDWSTDKLWWWTGTGTREIMVDEYETAVRTGFLTEFDARLIREMETFIYMEGKAIAEPPHHDDALIGDMICYQMRKFPYYTF